MSYCKCTNAQVENELSADKSPGNKWPGPVLSIVLSIEPLTRNYLSDLSREEEPIARPISVPLNVICRPGKIICVPLGLLSTFAECSSQFAFLKYLEDPQGVASGDRGPGPREDIDTRVLTLVETANRISYNDRRESRGDHCHLSTWYVRIPGCGFLISNAVPCCRACPFPCLTERLHCNLSADTLLAKLAQNVFN